MKKISILLLLNCVFMTAQTKTVVTQNGEKVTISPNVNNGLTATNGYIQLGGALTKPSVLTTTSSYTLALLGLQSGNSSNNILVTDSNGIVKTILATAFTPLYWGTSGNSNANPSTNFLGTTDGNDFVIKTNSTERIRVRSNGYTGIGLPSNSTYGNMPNYMLDVVNDIHIISDRVNYTSGRLIFENQQTDNGLQGSGIYLLDGQPNGSRREWFFGKKYGGGGSAGSNNFVLKSRLSDNLDYGVADGGTTHLYVDGLNNRIGIGTESPTNSLQVSASTDPVRFTGLQSQASMGGGDNVVIANSSGVLKLVAASVLSTTPSDARLKKEIVNSNYGLNFITRLRPVTYKLKTGTTSLQTGFIAQEVEAAANELQYDFNGVVKPLNDANFYSLRYDQFVTPLVKAVQEQQNQIQSYETMIKDLQQTQAKQQTQIDAYENKIKNQEIIQQNQQKQISELRDLVTKLGKK